MDSTRQFICHFVFRFLSHTPPLPPTFLSLALATIPYFRAISSFTWAHRCQSIFTLLIKLRLHYLFEFFRVRSLVRTRRSHTVRFSPSFCRSVLLMALLLQVCRRTASTGGSPAHGSRSACALANARAQSMGAAAMENPLCDKIRCNLEPETCNIYLSFGKENGIEWDFFRLAFLTQCISLHITSCMVLPTPLHIMGKLWTFSATIFSSHDLSLFSAFQFASLPSLSST